MARGCPMTDDMQRASELLPCPWCGNALKFGNVSEGSSFRWRKVDGCCADGPEVRHYTVADDQEAAEVDSRRRAIEAWNTRAALRATPEAEALRIAMTTLEQIASTPRNKGARMNAKATLLFLQTQLAARPQGVES